MSAFDTIISWVQKQLAKKQPLGIEEQAFESMQELARSNHPDETLVFLKTKTYDKSNIQSFPYDSYKTTDLQQSTYPVITDFYMIPSTKTSQTRATVNSMHVPFNVIGTLHTHPSGSQQESEQDKQMFSQYALNIIWGAPYTTDSYSVYSSQGGSLTLPIVRLYER